MKKITLMIVLCLLAGSGFAFNPCVPWVHDEITESAAKQLGGFSDDVIKKLKSAVRAVDYGESKKKVLPPFHQPNDDYDPAHHFDRPPSIAIVTHKDAFIKGAEYLRSQKQKAINDAKAGKTDDALAALGRALHALQDFKAHSNYIDLTPAEQKQARDALMDENKNSPANLKLTGFNRNAENPGRPVGDPYPHDDYCKDSHRYPESKKDGVGGINKCKLAEGWS